MWAELKEKRENYSEKSEKRFFNPSIDNIFKTYSTELYDEGKLYVENGCIDAEFLLFPLHSSLVEIMTNNKTSEVIAFIKKNKSISREDLEVIGIANHNLKGVIALIDKLGIAKKQI